MPWLPTPLHKEPPALDAPLFQGPLNAHATLQFVLQLTLQGAIRHAKPPENLGVGGVRGGGWVAVGSGQTGGRTAVVLGSSGVSERKRIKTSGGLLGSVVHVVMYH